MLVRPPCAGAGDIVELRGRPKGPEYEPGCESSLGARVNSSGDRQKLQA